MIDFRRWISLPILQIFDPVRAAGVALARRIDWASAVPDRPTVLCLERSQFIKDIEELRQLTNLNWVTLNAVRLKERQEVWVAESDREQGYFSTWLKEERCRHLRPILEKFAVALLKEACRTLKIDAVITANIDYWQDEAIKLACNKLGIPFLVLCRENYTIPWTVPWMHDHLKKSRFHFDGAGLAVFSQATKDAFAPAFESPDDIWVTGAPRYDRHLYRESSNVAKSHLSLITFNDPGYMAVDTFLEVAEIFDQVARHENHKGLTWLVKCKKRGDRKEVLNRIGSLDGSPLQFEYSTSLFELFPRSRIVVGYNSLALIEAMLTDAPILVPCWGQTRSTRNNLLLDYNDPLTRKVVNFADTPEIFSTMLTNSAQGKLLPTGSRKERLDLFKAHLHLPNNDSLFPTASAAIEAFIKYYIDGANK